MIYIEQSYTVSRKANLHLLEMFDHKHPNSINRRNNSHYTYDGTTMVVTEPNLSYRGASHGLNVLANETTTSPLYWRDNRTEPQQQQCAMLLEPPVFKSYRERTQYVKDFGPHRYACAWSTEDVVERDPETDKPLPPNYMYLRLSPSAMQFYRQLALLNHMMPLVPPINYTGTLIQHVSATLEAIGCGWLLPPENYYELVTNVPNQNMVRKVGATGGKTVKGRRVYGNHKGTAYEYKPLSTYKEEQNQLISNPELVFKGMSEQQIMEIKVLLGIEE